MADISGGADIDTWEAPMTVVPRRGPLIRVTVCLYPPMKPLPRSPAN